jgi:hypothetical protein
MQRIECIFTATGQTGGGWGKKNARLVTVRFDPVKGDPVKFPVVADHNAYHLGQLVVVRRALGAWAG